MGYNTSYELEAFPLDDPDSKMDVAMFVREIEEQFFEGEKYVLEDNGSAYDVVKWYDHADHMAKFSLTHPDIVFCLHGEGEENDDMWIKYFHNGKIQVAKAKITYDSFDANKLETK